MAPKKAAREAASTTAPANVATGTAPSSTTAPLAAVIPTPTTTGSATWDKVLVNLYNHYVDKTPQRIKLLDVFLAFLVAVGALQFFYCVLVGNFVRLYPPRKDKLQTEGQSASVVQLVETDELQQTTDILYFSLSMPSSQALEPPSVNSS